MIRSRAQQHVHQLQSERRPMRFDPKTVADITNSYVIAPVVAEEEITAYIIVSERIRPLDEIDFVAIEQSCHTRGEDTPFALLESSVQAMRKEAAGAKFMTVSGDLIAHAFPCKYGAVFPHAARGETAADDRL